MWKKLRKWGSDDKKGNVEGKYIFEKLKDEKIEVIKEKKN